MRLRRSSREPPPAPPEADTRPITPVAEEQVVTTRRRRAPRIWPWLIAVLLAAAAAIAAAYFLTRDDDEPVAATATVPDVVGLRAERATRTVAAAGFRPSLQRVPSERPRRVVIAQMPAAGNEAGRGGTVTLVVSRGPATVKVPDVVGLSLAQAFRRVEAAQLRPQARRVFSPRPKGRVFRQRPTAGTELEREQVVLLTVSRGRGRVAVPDVVGLREAAAVQALEAADLAANTVRVAAGEPAGLVVAQNPASGARVARGSTVRVNVSRGPPATTAPRRTTTRRRTTATTTTTTTTRTTTTTPTGTASSVATVPDVVGLDRPTAERRLQQAGFTVRTVPRDTSDPAQDGIVLEQRPPGGSSGRVGTQVTITVGLLVP
jgi:beta-lactam-binding protein with PASTA domain